MDTTIFKGMIMGFILSLPFGPVGIYCMELTIIEGRWKGYITALGMVTIDMVYSTVALLFLSGVKEYIVKYENYLSLIIGLFLLVISSIVYIGYVVFIGGMISIFKEYVGNEYLRTKIVDQIREQTRLTQDSANVSTKDMHFIFQVMGQLAWPYFALLIVLFLLLIYVLFKKNINHNVVAFLLLVYSILLLIFSLGILFISCIVYFFLGVRIILKRNSQKYNSV